MTEFEELPRVIEFLLPEESAVWAQKQPGGATRREIVEKAIEKAARERTFSAQSKLEQLIEDEFRGISPKRADHLQDMLANAFAGKLDEVHQGTLAHWRDKFTTSLLDWRQQSIFQAPKYRKLLVDCWTEAIRLARDSIEMRDMVNFVGNTVAEAFHQANLNGQAHLRSRGEPAWSRHNKVCTGLASNINATLEAAAEFDREAKATSRVAIVELCAASIAGLLEGLDQPDFIGDDERPVSPHALMSQADPSWAEVKSVLHLLSFSDRKTPHFVTTWLAENSVEKQLIDGLWIAAKKISLDDSKPTICPVAKRAGVSGDRIEFPVAAVRDASDAETVFVTVFLKPVKSGKYIRDLLTDRQAGARYGLIVARQHVAEVDRAEGTLQTQVPALPIDAAPISAHRVADAIKRALDIATDTGLDPAVIETRNFPEDFPLEEWSRLSEKYLVERPSVEAFVQRLLERRGLHVSCGMRRGGKTTAFHPDVLRRMQIHDGDVVVETCRSNGPLPVKFFSWLQEQYRTCGELTNAAFDDWCATHLAEARLFVLDEHESLFRWLVGISQERPTARSVFVDRLLDGFVRASERWGFLFLGLEPGAARIFMADNPLTPRMQAHAFPYFAHEPGSRNSEFARLVQVVITKHLDIDSLLIDRLHYESGGHPHFAVTLLRTLVDWAIAHRSLINSTLSSNSWDAFTRQRLKPATMRQSEWFDRYKKLHEGLREDPSPWVRGISRLAEGIGEDECSVAEAVGELGKTQKRNEDWALTAIEDAVQASILARTEHDTVRLTVPAYGRLASSWRRR